MSIEISVVIVQYNPILEKIKKTLMSVFRQKNCDYEIVIADDGSDVDFFSEIELFMKKNDISQYKFVKCQKNQGTVKNVISGLENARGKYVRVISPGDYIYSEHTLEHIVNFMKNNDAKEGFGKLAGYQSNNGVINVWKARGPYGTEGYKKNVPKRTILKRLVAYGDNISGAAYTWERQYYLECLRKIEDKVVYLEDCVNAYTVLEDNKIYFMDEYVTWYECGTGVTTSGSKKWLRLLSKDWEAFFDCLEEEYPKDCIIRRGRLLKKMASKDTFLSKVLLNLCFLDRFLYFKIGVNIGNRDDMPDATLLETVQGGYNASN